MWRYINNPLTIIQTTLVTILLRGYIMYLGSQQRTFSSIESQSILCHRCVTPLDQQLLPTNSVYNGVYVHTLLLTNSVYNGVYVHTLLLTNSVYNGVHVHTSWRTHISMCRSPGCHSFSFCLYRFILLCPW